MTSPDRDRKTLGGGAEAAEGVHALQNDDAGTKEEGATPATQRTGASDVRTDGASAKDESGSEPLSRTREHVSGYGGAGGAPRSSSDTREPADARGDEGGSAGRIPDAPDQRPVNPT